MIARLVKIESVMSKIDEIDNLNNKAQEFDEEVNQIKVKRSIDKWQSRRYQSNTSPQNDLSELFSKYPSHDYNRI